MIQAQSCRPLLGILLLCGAVLTGQDVRGASAGGLVNCYDSRREMVARTRADACQGQAVSDAEAAAIRERRRAYVKESLAEKISPAVLGKRLVGMGAGFFVDGQGAILTNAHVVKGCSTLTVSFQGDQTQPANLRDLDLSLDLALLTTGLRPKRHAVFASPDRPLSQEIAIVGYPDQARTLILTRGAISADDARSSRARPLPLKADVRPGNSGGPVLDTSGHVLGVVFAAIDTKGVYAQTGRVVRDIGMAIPNRIALGFLRRNGVKPATDDPAAKSPNLLEDARRYVARIECWL